MAANALPLTGTLAALPTDQSTTHYTTPFCAQRMGSTSLFDFDLLRLFDFDRLLLFDFDLLPLFDFEPEPLLLFEPEPLRLPEPPPQCNLLGAIRSSSLSNLKRAILSILLRIGGSQH